MQHPDKGSMSDKTFPIGSHGNAKARSALVARVAQPRWVFSGLFLFSLLFFLLLLRAPRIDGQLIGSDGVAYYVYARSLVIDHDLDFTNEFTYFQLKPAAFTRTPAGHIGNKYAVGPALLWMPFFLAAHALALAARALGLGLAADGYSYLYQSAISIGSIVYGSLGFWMAYACTRRMFSQLAALAAVGLLWLGSNSFYYMTFEPSMSHMVSLFSVALLLSIWFVWFRNIEQPALRRAAALGAAGGLVLLVRLQDAPFLLLPYGYLLIRCIQTWRAGSIRAAQHWLVCGLIAMPCTLLVFAPQLAVWQHLYGTWAVSPYFEDHIPAFQWLHPQLGGVLVSTFHGLFTWHPIYLFALCGLAVVAQQDRRLAILLAALLLLEVYIVSAWWAWWQGDSFGGRMFLSAIWIWVLGLAGSLEWARTRRLFSPMLAVGLLLIVWNGLSLIQYRLGFVPMSAPLTWQQMTIDRLRIPWLLLRKLWS
jgi:hypothetical protein